MTKREEGHCKGCGKNAGEENLSRGKKLCYDCAKEAMVKFFDSMWAFSHPRDK